MKKLFIIILLLSLSALDIYSQILTDGPIIIPTFDSNSDFIKEGSPNDPNVQLKFTVNLKNKNGTYPLYLGENAIQIYIDNTKSAIVNFMGNLDSGTLNINEKKASLTGNKFNNLNFKLNYAYSGMVYIDILNSVPFDNESEFSNDVNEHIREFNVDKTLETSYMSASIDLYYNNSAHVHKNCNCLNDFLITAVDNDFFYNTLSLETEIYYDVSKGDCLSFVSKDDNISTDLKLCENLEYRIIPKHKNFVKVIKLNITQGNLTYDYVGSLGSSFNITMEELINDVVKYAEIKESNFDKYKEFTIKCVNNFNNAQSYTMLYKKTLDIQDITFSNCTNNDNVITFKTPIKQNYNATISNGDIPETITFESDIYTIENGQYVYSKKLSDENIDYLNIKNNPSIVAFFTNNEFLFFPI